MESSYKPARSSLLIKINANVSVCLGEALNCLFRVMAARCSHALAHIQHKQQSQTWLSKTILFLIDPAVSYFHPPNDVCETTVAYKKSLPLGKVPLVATCENRNN